MAKLFKKAADLKFAERISRIVYCNPFTAERLRLEEEVLGTAKKPDVLEWNLDPQDLQRHVNMERMLKKIQPLLDSLRSDYLKGKGDGGERARYADLVIFLLYIQVRESFDALIESAHRHGMRKRRIVFYKPFHEGFLHYFGKDQPIQPEHLFACYFQIRRAFHHIFLFFVGTSIPAMQLRARMWQSIFSHDLYRYQRSLYRHMATIPILVMGPSGSGKEVVARAIGLSQYVPFDAKQQVFISDFTTSFFAVSLSALSPTLIESELFGHRKGAFTGALQDREGYFASCGEDGTVFLDEIGDTDQNIQVKLLRVLQTREFQRLGDVRSEPFRGKLIAATNRDLEAEISRGRFREDFFFRLRSDIINTLPLEEMLAGNPGELAFLAEYASGKLAGEAEAASLAGDFIEWAKDHPKYRWPGNFRELQQALRSILVHGNYDPPKAGNGDADGLPERLVDTGWSLRKLTEVYVQAVYQQTPVLEEVARRLGVDRRTVKKYLAPSRDP